MMKKGEEKAVEPGVAMIEVDDTSSSPSASLQLSDLPPEVLIIHILKLRLNAGEIGPPHTSRCR